MDEKKVREAIVWMKNKRTIHECSTYISPSIPKEQISLIEEYYNLAVEALEKQLPKKPELINNGISVCQECGAKVFRHYDFCRDCGQKLDWRK